jgi:phage/plasmid-associated DNA primase
MTVYTNYRVIRTPLSYKEEDPLKTKMMPCEYNGTEWVTRPITDEEQILDYLITHLPVSVILLPDSEQYTTSKSQNHASGVSRRQNPPPAPSEQNSAQEATILAQVQRMVDTKGGLGCVVYNIQQTFDDGTMRIQCKNDGQRKCLVTKDEIHENDHAFITVYPDGRVMYNCYSKPCSDCELGVQIGKLQPFLDIAVSELALMGPAMTFEDALDVIKTASRAAGERITAKGVHDLEEAVAEWLNRLSTLTVQNNLDLKKELQSTDGSFECEKDALSELWSKRKQQCAIRFKTGAELVNSPDLELAPVFFLRNVDLQSTHVYSLVLCMRLLWPDSHDVVHDYVRFYYKKEQACGLADIASFDKVWKTEHDLAPGGAFISSIKRHIAIELKSHPFIRRAIPELMGNSVFCYKKGNDDLQFLLDDGTATKRDYRLDYCTGEIAAEGEGILRTLYDDVRELISTEGSTISMSKLVVKKGFGHFATFDAEENLWRIYDTKSCLWRFPLTECEPHALLSQFVATMFKPIESFAQFLGKTFDWVTGRFDEEDCEDDNASQVMEDDSASVCTVGSKRKKTQKPAATSGQKSINKLRAATFKFVESLKHQGDVLKAAQHLLIVKFSHTKPHLLPCVNGIVDLCTREIRQIEQEDFITWVCPTAYNPDADVGPARDFYNSFLPNEPGAYPDQEELVDFLSMWMGYSISGETNLEMCVYFYGVGSNSKSTQTRLNTLVLGEDMCHQVPMECLCKKKGENNDALHDALRARVVMINESDKSLKIHESAFRSLISGEKTKSKTMYKREKDAKPEMKISFFVNNLPTFEDNSAFCTARRNAYFPLRKIFVDEKVEADRIQIANYREMKMPECLIADKDRSFFETNVMGYEQNFLKFWVDGAAKYYSNGKNIDIPQSLQEQSRREVFDVESAMDEFVDDKLEVSKGVKTSVKMLYKEFELMFPNQIDNLTFDIKKFGAELKKKIEAKGVAWDVVKKRNGGVGGEKGMLWVNLAIRLKGPMKVLVKKVVSPFTLTASLATTQKAL